MHDRKTAFSVDVQRTATRSEKIINTDVNFKFIYIAQNHIVYIRKWGTDVRPFGFNSLPSFLPSVRKYF